MEIVACYNIRFIATASRPAGFDTTIPEGANSSKERDGDVIDLSSDDDAEACLLLQRHSVKEEPAGGDSPDDEDQDADTNDANDPGTDHTMNQENHVPTKLPEHGNGASEAVAEAADDPKRRRTAADEPERGSGELVAASSSSRKKIHRSPDDILLPISPQPACAIRLNFNDHRFGAYWKPDIDSTAWVDEMSRKSFSRCFTSETWRDKLIEVHEFAWRKWHLAKHEPDLELEYGSEPQEPGVIPNEIFEDLEPVITTMPPPKQYGGGRGRGRGRRNPKWGVW